MDGYNYLEKLMEHTRPSIGYVMLSDSIDRFTEVLLGGKEFGKVKLVEDKTEEGEISQAVEKITSQADQQRLYREAVALYNSGNYEDAWEIEKQLVNLNAEYGKSVLVIFDRYQELYCWDVRLLFYSC